MEARKQQQNREQDQAYSVAFANPLMIRSTTAKDPTALW
jgi:hypothetical protein